MPYPNTTIRSVILTEHDELRSELSSIEAQLDLVASGDVPAQAALHARMAKFLGTFLHHIENEEEILRPVLKDIDAWGPQRIARMDTEHLEQRALVLRLSGVTPAAAAQEQWEWVAEVRSFINRLREDMVSEEHDCLDPTVLRDDLIAIDVFGG